LIGYNRQTVEQKEEETKKPDMLWLNLLIAGCVLLLAIAMF
jgi:DNA-binding XRE family transcriptional regulator